MRRKPFFILLCLIGLNFVVFWMFIYSERNLDIQNRQLVKEKLDVTIVIPEFAHFDNDISRTVQEISKTYPSLRILIISEGIPYPYPKLTTKLAKYVYKDINPSISRQNTDPMNFLKSNYVFLMPDGTRLLNNVIEKLIWKLKLTKTLGIVAVPISNEPSRCHSIDINLKLWTLKYTKSQSKSCDQIKNKVAMLFERKIFTNFSEIFMPPFYDSFFIQAKINKIKISIVDNKKEKYLRYGKFLFTDKHKKWKYDQKLVKDRQALYHRFGIKRVITANGEENWHGCNKNKPRCFPTVIDVPSYLYQGRWTPPCCLANLRTTAQHVFDSLEYSGIVYWLEGGSLLGAARHNDIIPWDYDVDIGIYVNDTKKVPFLKDVWSGRKRYVDIAGFVWERATEGDFIRVQYSVVNHMHVDIFPFYEKNGVMTKNTWFKSHRQDMEFPARYLKPLERLMFAGIEAMVPNHYKQFLEMKFGKGVIENPQYPFPEKLLDIKI